MVPGRVERAGVGVTRDAFLAPRGARLSAWLALGLVLTAAPALAGKEPAAAGAEGGGPSSLLRATWVDSGLPRLGFEVMVGEARSIMRQMGVWLEVQRVPCGTPPERPGQIRITPIDEVVAGRPILGAASVPWRKDRVAYIWIFRPQVAQLLSDWVGRGALWRERDWLEGRLLGRIVAHELVHALVPELRHSETGLMAPRIIGLPREAVVLEGRTASAIRKAVEAMNEELDGGSPADGDDVKLPPPELEP